MNFKKIAVTAAAAGVMLSAAIPAFANGDGDFLLVKIKNWAYVKNDVDTTANTGFNAILAGDDVKGGKIKTGNAEALSVVSNMVNTNVVDLCECLDGEDDSAAIIKIKNGAKVKNYVDTTANTGFNLIGAEDDVKGGRIRTGDAGAGALVENVVNSNIVGGSAEED